MDKGLKELLRKSGVCFPVVLVLISFLIPTSRATGIVTEDEQVVYWFNEVLCRFKVKVVVETEKDGTWRVSQAENEYKYDISFLITMIHVNPGLLEEGKDYPQLRIHFHSPWSGGDASLDENVHTNSSWFDTEWHHMPSQLDVTARALLEWRVKLEPRFEYSVYHYNSSLEADHIFTSHWYSEPIYIDVTQSGEDALLTQIDWLKTELVMIKSLMYVLTLTSAVLILTTVYFATRKSKTHP